MSTPDSVHRLAFDALLQLPGTAESQSSQVEHDLAMLPPAERDRAFHVAARRLAFQLLYQIDAGAEGPEHIRRTLSQVDGLGPIDLDRTAGLVEGAHANRAVADAEFLALAPDWPTHRQAAVDRAILRLAHFEMTSGLTPPRIVVHECVELAKHFSTERSPAFINALLDKVLKRLNPE